MGASIYALLRALWGCLYQYPLGVIYFFPTDTDVQDFSRGRVTPLLNQNPSIRNDDVQNVGLKRIGPSWLYFRGMKSNIAMKSVPADLIVFDELDEADPVAMDLARKRTGHSEFKHEIQLSVPSLPDYGIDRDFQQSDQREWLLKCGSCGTWTDLIGTFPDCLQRRRGHVFRACRCGAALDPSIGEWVPRYPDRQEIRGYHLSQLFSSFVSPASILREFETARSPAEFYRSVIGLPWVNAEDRLSADQVLACCGSHGIEASGTGAVMGVDIGAPHWAVIADRDRRVLWCGEVFGIGDLDRLMARFEVARCVVDLLPEQELVRAFAARWPGRVYLCSYAEHQRGGPAWREDTQMVAVNRTEAIDAVVRGVREQRWVFPRADLCGTLVRHLTALARTVEEDRETGSRRMIWVRTGPDHLAHAMVYADLAIGSSTPAAAAWAMAMPVS